MISHIWYRGSQSSVLQSAVQMRDLIEYFRRKALDVICADEPVAGLLHEFADRLQAALPHAVVGITVLDKPGLSFRHAIFPSLPASFSGLIANKPFEGARRGSCGLAVLHGKAYEVTDIATDPRMKPEWRMLMLAHGLQSVLSTPAIGSDGLPHGAISTSFRGAIDLTEAQRSAIAEAAILCAQLARYSRSREARELLLGELDHRIRNLFSSVGAVANLTLRGHPDPLDFQRVLGSRLVIMARAHALAVSPVETSLDVLLSEALAPYSSDFQIRCVGPDITLAKEAAAALALTIHELATNARKYGALSTTGGNIEVLWSIALSPDDGGGEVFNLSWSESGGPAVSPPSRRGFGSRTVSSSVRSAFDGSAEVQYLPAGIVCNISAPLSSRFGYLSGVAA